MTEAALWMGGEARKEGVEIRLKTAVTPDLIEEIGPDEVILALGARPMTLNVPGKDLPQVISSHDLLGNKAQAHGAVVVIGGGLVGLEAAEFLVGKASTITVVERLDQVAGDIGPIRKISVLEGIFGSGVSVFTGAKCVEIKENAVVIERDGERKELPADAVITAIGAEPVGFSPLTAYCEKAGLPCHVIGDAVEARRALDAVREAGEVARRI